MPILILNTEFTDLLANCRIYWTSCRVSENEVLDRIFCCAEGKPKVKVEFFFLWYYCCWIECKCVAVCSHEPSQIQDGFTPNPVHFNVTQRLLIEYWHCAFACTINMCLLLWSEKVLYSHKHKIRRIWYKRFEPDRLFLWSCSVKHLCDRSVWSLPWDVHYIGSFSYRNLSLNSTTNKAFN